MLLIKNHNQDELGEVGMIKKIDIITYDEPPLFIIRARRNQKCLGEIKCTRVGKRITIGDIQCKENNKGYGSLMMKALIDYARQQRIAYLDGWLSEVDSDHLERLYHFYQKFGFEIIPCKENMKIADIKLTL